MSHQPPQPDPLTSGPHYPEHDPSASYALEPDYVAALTGRIVSTSGESKLSVSPINNQPLAHIPQSSAADVVEAFARARRAPQAWARPSLDHRAGVLLRLHDLVMHRSEDPPGGEGCVSTFRSR